MQLFNYSALSKWRFAAYTTEKGGYFGKLISSYFISRSFSSGKVFRRRTRWLLDVGVKEALWSSALVPHAPDSAGSGAFCTKSAQIPNTALNLAEVFEVHRVCVWSMPSVWPVSINWSWSFRGKKPRFITALLLIVIDKYSAAILACSLPRP